ncbi:TonB-dependent receptor [Massilia antarctica]|uniref:TonB-dependent receptor n=1 Tax=Massilia antarctica TaxID=2765360 RepID=UPI0006BDE49E|nr:TonB-dependent receptor [Massilia sp. H27-R4]MCY0914667.1 TonB-dependent receptor [Massilia sp. H27-R4]CUI08304.1 TonB-dependent receptor, in a cluster with 3-phytase [Janthinobacterium sp. CG23_2]CUU32090.1 TonB-dependent receptor, in a cluster with 3-phytase [Janthinobacterium sp. CG23_2]
MSSDKQQQRRREVAGSLPRLSFIAFGILQLCSGVAHGADSAAGSGEASAIVLDTVVIAGQRSSMKRALAAQRKADNIVSIVSSDDIGGLPDKNAAEALARLPGVAVQRDQGEGRYIVVRGMGPDYNAVTINGASVPSPEAGRRAVALDVLPAGLIRSLEVSKTLMPDQDANSLGGSVDVKSLSAFDLPGTALSFQAGASRDQNTGKTSPNAGALWADRFLDGKLGVAAGVSGERRKFGSDNVETGGAWNKGKLSGLELRDYLPERERNALALNVDYRPQAGRSLYLHTFLSRFSDEEVRDRLSVGNIAGGAVVPDTAFTARAERRLRQRTYTQQIGSAVVGGELRVGEWKLAASGGASRATEDTPESINDGRFRAGANVAGLRFSGTDVPCLTGPASLADPASYSLQSITLQARDSKDAERHVRLDLSRRLALGDAAANIAADIKGGVKSSRRIKENDTEQWAYTSSKAGSGNYWGAGRVSMSGFTQGVLDYPFANLGPGLDPALIRARVAGLDRAGARLVPESNLNDFSMDEDIDSAYVQAGADIGNWRLLAGVRHERTSFAARGQQVSGALLRAVSRTNGYANWLPDLQARFDIDKDTSVRAAWTNAVVRANFSQLAPGISLASNTEAVIGNPDLKPLKAANVDLGIERMLGADGAVSAYLYSKDIKNFTYTTDLAGSGAWAGYTTATSYANGDKARLNGIELSYSQSLRMLPAPWNGLLVGANASFNDAKATIGRFDKASGGQLTREIRLPGQSKQIVNLMLGYESGPVSTRLALNHKSAYLLEVGGDLLDASQDRYVDAQRQVDFSLGYQIGKRVQLVFEGINLNNETYYVYQGTKPYNVQYEQYGRTFKLSLKASFF